MLDVLFLTINDWANTGWRFFKCAQMLGLKTMGFKGIIHPFYYPEQLPVFHELVGIDHHNVAVELKLNNQLDIFVRNSKIIHFVASNYIHTGTDLRDKAVVMQHGGRTYRVLCDKLNPVYNEFVDATIIQMPDLLGLGAKNEHLIYFPVDTNFIKPSFEKVHPVDKLVIGCFASQPGFKGEDEVLIAINKLTHLKNKFEFRIPNKKVTYIWLENLERVKECDLIIDVFAKTAYGLSYGEWGNASFEAAALGKIVVTMSLNFDKYLAEYGDCALNITNTEDKLLETLSKFIEMPHAELCKEKKRTRAWVEKKHSLAATSEKLLPIYKSIMS